MKKIIYIFCSLFLTLILIASYLNNELIIQGEVDTKNVSLSSKITGRVISIPVEEGDIVKKGDVLVSLDIPDIMAQQKQAEAAFTLAKKKFERVKVLNASGHASSQAYDDAFSGLTQTENKYKEVSSYVDEHTIIAPISGQVKEISVEEGELVGAGYPIITMIDTTDSWIVFNLKEDLLSKIKMGTVFDVKIPALGKGTYKFKVDYISAMGNYTTWRATKIRGDFDLKTFEIRARPVSPIEGLIAGMSVLTDWKKIK